MNADHRWTTVMRNDRPLVIGKTRRRAVSRAAPPQRRSLKNSEPTNPDVSRLFWRAKSSHANLMRFTSRCHTAQEEEQGPDNSPVMRNSGNLIEIVLKFGRIGVQTDVMNRIGSVFFCSQSELRELVHPFSELCASNYPVPDRSRTDGKNLFLNYTSETRRPPDQL